MGLTIKQGQVVQIGESEVEFIEIYSHGQNGGVQRIRIVVRAPKKIKISRDKFSLKEGL